MKILILCTGNSCRSQMAEGFLRSLDKSLEIYSAGTRPEKEINPNTITVMQEIGVLDSFFVLQSLPRSLFLVRYSIQSFNPGLTSNKIFQVIRLKICQVFDNDNIIF